MSEREFLEGLTRTFVNVLKRKGCYAQYRKNLNAFVRRRKKQLDDYSTTRVQTSMFHSYFSPMIHFNNDDVMEAARGITRGVDVINWSYTVEGWSFWNRVNTSVKFACRLYISKNKPKLEA